MEALPAEMIEEILVRLAAKSLLRFKCVCRRWCALIQSRSFIHRHYYHDSNQERLLSQNGVYVLSQTGEYVEGRFEKRCDDGLMLSYFGGGFYRYRMGSVFGLLCDVNVDGDIVLLNPATHMVKRVPQLPTVEVLGFGLDPSSGDCKIVASQRGAAETSVWVFNSSSDCWKRVEVVGSSWLIKAVSRDWSLNGVFSNGVCYWVVMKGGYMTVLAFDMMSEKFREIKAPHRHEVHAYTFFAYGDSIALMSWAGNECELWVMGKQGIWTKSWVLKDSYWMRPLSLWKNKVFFINYQGQTYNLVDLSTGEVKRVEVEPPILPMQYLPFSYKESLFWIND